MRGEVLSFDPATQAGLIAGADGVRYGFTTADLAAPVPVHPGAVLDFVPVGSAATQVTAAPGQAVATAPAGGGLFSPVTPDTVGEPSLSVWGYVKRCLRKYADFNGRARRKEYWSFSLAIAALCLPIYLVQVFFIVLLSAASSNGTHYDHDAATLGSIATILIFGGLLVIIAVAVVLPSYAVMARRFHDVGLSAWWMLIALVPGLSIALLIVSLMDSQPGANIYGGYPKPVT